ncbi:MAG: hypothetical protein ACMXYB_04465 [Candidatus Woesearchaeota archaeon]
MESFKLLLHIVCISIISIVGSHAFEICNVNFEEPWFQVEKDDENVLLIDNQGNVYIEALVNVKNSNQINSYSVENSGRVNVGGSSPSENSLLVGSGSIFSNNYARIRSYSDKLSTITQDGLIVKNSDGQRVAAITNSGDVYAKGSVVLDSSSANCPSNRLCVDGDCILKTVPADISCSRGSYVGYATCRYQVTIRWTETRTRSCCRRWSPVCFPRPSMTSSRCCSRHGMDWAADFRFPIVNGRQGVQGWCERRTTQTVHRSRTETRTRGASVTCPEGRHYNNNGGCSLTTYGSGTFIS